MAEITGYVDVVFIDGDEGNELTDKLYDVEGVVAHGVSAEAITEAIAYLSEWDAPGDGEIIPELSAGSQDDRWEEGDYILSANLGLGYIALTRVIRS